MEKIVCRFLSAFRCVTPPAPASVLLLLLGGVVFLGWVTRSRASLILNIAPSGTNALVYWTNAGVTLQSSLNVTGTWNDLTGAVSPYLTPATNKTAFFRLHQTSSSPAFITDIEPAYLTTNGGTFYLVGTNFGSASQVYLDGNLASVTFINSNLLSVSISAFGAGTYNVSVVNGGQTNAVLADGLTVESTPQASLEVPPGMSPAVTAAGEVRQSFVDLVIPSGVGPSFVLARSYRSRIGPTNSPLGNGWDFSSDVFIQTNGANVVVNDGCGRSDTFFLQSDGTYSRAGFFRQGAFSGSVFTLTFADTSQWQFNALNAPVAPGKIARSVDRNGNAMTYAYNATGQLTNVTDALGRPIQFSYNGSGQLTSVRDYAGRTMSYTYDSNNNLSSATTPAVTGTPNGNDYPEGKTTTYTYDNNHHLTSVIDPTGTVVETNQYSPDSNPSDLTYDHVTSIALGTNPPTVYSYQAQTPTPANRYATTEMYVNDPVGNVTMAQYDSRNRPVQIYQYTGRATPGVPVTATSNRPTGRLRSSDPAYYQTTCSYDLNSLATQITEPRGNSVAMVYEFDANNAAPVREGGNLLALTQTPAPGAPADQTQRVDQWQYLPGFGTGEGQALTCRQYRPGRPTFGAVESVNHRTFRPGRMTSGAAEDVKERIFRPGRPTFDMAEGDYKPQKEDQGVGFEGIISAFPTNHIDPRGNITSATYDPNGNLLTVQPPGIATGVSYAYNTAGQLTSQTYPADANGRRQHDTFIYYTSGVQNGYLQSAVADAGGSGLSGLALTTSYAYDAFGNTTNIVDPRGNNSQYVYNQLDQLMQISSPTGPAGMRSQVTFTYDAAGTGGGRVISQSVLNFDQNGVTEASSPLNTSFGYDAISRLTSVTNEVSGSSFTVTRYAYDADGEVTSMTSPLAVSGADAFSIIQYSYDERGLPFEQTSAPGSTSQSTTQYNYDANANLASVNEGLEGTPRTTTVVADGFAGSHDGVLIGNHKDCLMDASSGGLATSEGLINDLGHTINVGCLAMAGGVPFDYRPQIPRTGDVDVAFNRDEWAKTGIGLTISAGLINDSGHSISDAGLAMSEVLPTDNRTPTRGFLTAEGSYIGFTTQSPWPKNDCGTIGGQGVYGTSTGGQLAGAVFSGRKRLQLGYACSVARSAFGDGSGHINRVRFADRVKNGTETDIAAATSGFVVVPDRVRSRCTCDGVPQVITHEGRLEATLHWVLEVRVQRVELTAIFDPQGNVITNHFDANGNLVSSTLNGTNGIPSGGGNVLLSSNTAQYDALDRLTNCIDAVVDAQGNVVTSAQTSVALADNGETTAFTDADGHTTTYAYDTVSRLSSETDPKGNSTSYTYDPDSNIAALTNRLKSDLGNPDLVFTKTYSYDALNRVTTSIDNVGNTTSYAYDSRSNPVQTTDPRGIVTQYQYDGLSRLTSSGVDMNNDGDAFSAGDIIRSYVYDGNSRLVSQTDPNGNVTSYAYDSLNRPIATTNADATVSSLAYDVNDNVISSTDANGTVVAYSYDLDNRLTAKSITPGSGVAATTTAEQYSYDGLGRIVYAANNNATNSFTYDSFDRKLTETQNGLTLTNTYDAVGNLLTVAYPGGRQLSYTYDTANLRRSATLLADPTGDTPGMICTNSYVGYLSESCTNRNGTYSLMGYDGAVGSTSLADHGWAEVSSIQYLNTNGTVIDDISLTYDAAQNTIGKTMNIGALVLAQSYIYDNADRLTNTVVLTNSVLERNTVYTLDLAGNRLNVTGDNHPGTYTLSNGTPQPADYQMNQYTTTPVGNLTYDLNGNRLTETVSGSLVRTYSYDYANRMVSATGAGSTPVATYAYDALGRRIQKAVGTGGASNTTNYVYDGDSVVEERDGTGTVFETVDDTIRVDGTDYYPHLDDDGSLTALTQANGSVAERYIYQDYGEPSFYNAKGIRISGSAVGNTFLYDGMMYDSESGFYEDAANIFDTRIAAALQRDIGNPMAEVRTEKIKFKQEFGPTQANKKN